jgi:tetratricopeptide (TPR) repeat protein
VKKYQEALGDFNAAIRYDPKFADTYYYRGAVYNDLGKFDEAIRDYNSAIKLKPDYPKAYFNRSGAYFHIHRYQNALSDALQAEKLGYPVDPLYIDAINEGMTRTVVQK